MAIEDRTDRFRKPTGHVHKRSAMSAMALPAMLLLEQVGLFPGAAQWAAEAVEQLKKRRDQVVSSQDPTEAVANRIGSTFPVLHGAHAMGSTAAKHWKTQINLNAKTLALSATYPDLCHGEVSAWGQNGDVTRQLFTLVNLRHDAEHPQVSRSFELVSEALREVVAGIVEVRAEGESDLAQLLDLCMFGDFVSLHLARDSGVDPGPVPAVSDLASQLGSTA